MYEEVHPFYSGKLEFSSDGGRLFVAYRAPAPGLGEGSEIPVLVYVDRTAEGWGEAVTILDTAAGSWASLGQPSVSRDGTLYLGARRSDSRNPTIIRIRESPGGYEAPEEVAEATGGMAAADAFIDPEERFLLFSGFDEEGFGALDLFVSFRRPDGGWTAPKNLGEGINTKHFERFPSLSRDGRFLFFVRGLGDSFGSASGDYYWVRAEILDRLRN